MKESAFSRFVCLVLLLTLGMSLMAETVEYSDIIQTQNTYRVGFNLLYRSNVQREGVYLLDTIPKLLLKEVEGCPEHTYSLSESQAVREDLIKSRLRKLYKDMESAQTARDELLFDNDSTKQELKQKKEDILEIQQEADFFLAMDPQDIDLTETLPLEFPEPTGVSTLYTENISLLDQQDHENLELLVYGTLEQFQDLYYITLRTYNYLTGEDFLLWEGGGGVDEIPDLMDQAARSLRGQLLGRPFGELIVDTGLSEGFIYLDGEYQGMGYAEMPYLAPGTYNLEITKPGYKRIVEEVVVEEYDEISLLREMAPQENPLMSLVTYPPGADVYLGSLFMGQTPLNLDLPSQPMLLTLAKEGYDTYKFGIGPDAEEHLVIDLSLGEMDANLLFKQEKIKFYRSLGWFSLAVGGTLISYSLSSYYNEQYVSTTNPDTRAQAGDLEKFFYYSWATCLTISGVLLANVFFRLYKMLRAAEAATWD